MVPCGICHVLQFGIRHNGDLVQERFQRGKRGRQRAQLSLTLRNPFRRTHPHRDVHKAQATNRVCGRNRCGRERGNHRIQEWQSERNSHSSKECPAGQGLFHDHHWDLLI
jgi:hypothetical protein